MNTYQEAKSYAENKELKAGDFGSVVEVEFVDAEMKIKWAFAEKKGEFVFVFAEHYPPIFQHVDETNWFRQKGFDGEVIKNWENDEGA